MADATPAFWTYWYDLGEFKNLRQGDILRGLTVLWFPQDMAIDEQALAKAAAGEGAEVEVEAEYSKGDWIVFTASCEMDNDPDAQVLLGRVLEATQTNLKAPDEEQLKQRLEVIKRGQYPTRFLLAEFENCEPPFLRSIVDFHFQVQMPIQYLLRTAQGPRLRMNSPFREQFGNWVGACMSRVGPENFMLIPRIVKQLFDAQVSRAMEGDVPGGPAKGQRLRIQLAPKQDSSKKA